MLCMHAFGGLLYWVLLSTTLPKHISSQSLRPPPLTLGKRERLEEKVRGERGIRPL